MQLLAPDLLTDARDFSIPVMVTGLIIGLLLWVWGWRGHRFWVVLTATLAAGIVGLYSGPDFGLQRLVAGLLLAVAAGALALALVRLVAFGAGGIATWLIVRTVAPSWDDLQGQLICLLAGGLVGLLLFRFWMMALTSALGTLLMAYSGFCLADRLGNLDCVAWSEQNVLFLNWVCIGGTVVGLVLQFYLDQRRRRWLRIRDEEVIAVEEVQEAGWRLPLLHWVIPGRGRRAG